MRLTSASWEVVERAAAALGISRDAYFERLVAREAAESDETGRPRWWADPVPGDQTRLSFPAKQEDRLKSA